MKIKGFYILTRRSVMRMLATITAALMLLCTTATAKAEATIRRIHDTAIALHTLDLQMVGRLTRTAVPPAKYRECKSVYLEAKQYNKQHPPSKAECCQYPVPTANRKPDGASATLERVPQSSDPNGQDARCPSAAISNGQDARCPSSAISNGQDARCPSAAPATKADLRAAVKTIIRGEDVFASKPGPRITPAKQRQIDAAKKWRATHAGCSLHNACMRSFVPAKGGYKNAAVLYSFFHRRAKS